MATVKEVKVVINGEEYVSKAAKSAETGMAGFTSKIPGWAQAAAVIAVAWKAIGAAIDFARDYVMDAIDAFDNYTASQNKMAAQSKLTGVSMADLKEAAKRAREEFGLSASAANDAATTTAKYASRAGDATMQNKLLAAALNLGAASGLTAAESMRALEMGLRGQDEGFDLLLGKNPSTIWKEYADANDLAVGKMTDMQKRMAELTAVVEAGTVVGTAYNDRLAGGAGKTEQLANVTDMMKVRFGQAIQPIRILIVEGLIKLIDLGTPVVVVIGKIANGIGVTLAGMVNLGRSAFGSLIEIVGKLTGNDELQAWGRKQSQAFPDMIRHLQDIEKKLNDSGEAATKSGRAHQLATVTVTASAKESADAVDTSATRMMNALDAKLGGPMRVVIGLTEGAIRSLAAAANEQLPPETAAKFDAHMKSLADNARAVEARLTGMAPPLESNSQTTGEMANEMATVARGALDAAQAFGVIDQTAASALNSAINIGASIAQIAGGNVFAGVSGLLGGVANIVNVMMNGDRERRRTMATNNARLEELNDTIGDLDLNVTGDDLLTAQDVLTKILPLVGSPQDAFKNSNAVREILAKAGMTFGDLARIADEMGINIKGANGSVDLALLPQLLQGLGMIEPGQFGSDFGSQLRSTRAGFDINNVDELGQIGQLANLGGTFSSALRGVFDAGDIEGSRARLQGLFTRLQSGGVSASELGGLTGSQFLELITDLIGRIDDLGNGTVGTGGGGGGDVITGPSGVTVPVSTSADILAGIVAQTEAQSAFHADALGYMARTADATEGSYEMLQRIDVTLTTLIDGGAEALNAKLEDERRRALFAGGQFPESR